MTGVSGGRGGVSQDDGATLVTANQKSIFASGTVYSLTNSAALLDFGTTDPSITIDSPGTYLIIARVRYELNGATLAASRAVTTKLRRTNNTAADLTNGTVAFNTPITTTVTDSLSDQTWHTIYTTTNSNDIIQLFGSINTVPSAGSVDATEASIIAIRLQQ